MMPDYTGLWDLMRATEQLKGTAAEYRHQDRGLRTLSKISFSRKHSNIQTHAIEPLGVMNENGSGCSKKDIAALGIGRRQKH